MKQLDCSLQEMTRAAVDLSKSEINERIWCLAEVFILTKPSPHLRLKIFYLNFNLTIQHKTVHCWGGKCVTKQNSKS